MLDDDVNVVHKHDDASPQRNRADKRRGSGAKEGQRAREGRQLRRWGGWDECDDGSAS
jgi:hypothetical protein